MQAESGGFWARYREMATVRSYAKGTVIYQPSPVRTGRRRQWR